MLVELIAEMLTLIGGLIVAYFVYVLITNRDDKPSTDSPTMAHTTLREIVERVVEEARKLPGLGISGGTGKPQEAKNIVEHSYEDLLASAILNKVIEKYQKDQVDGNRNVLHGKQTSMANGALSESEAGLDEGVEEGCSSLEPLSQDDCSSECSASCSKRVRNQPEPLSLTIEEQIEEVTTTYTSDDDQKENDTLGIRSAHRVPFPELGMDIVDPSQESEDSEDEGDTSTAHIDLVSPVESWEENWLFQRKRVQTQADPVAMLVPNPSADFKALIGDKDAEDTSDLSDCSSAQSDEEIEKELMEAISNVVPRSPELDDQSNRRSSQNEFSFETNLKNSEHPRASGRGIATIDGFEEADASEVNRKYEEELCLKNGSLENGGGTKDEEAVEIELNPLENEKDRGEPLIESLSGKDSIKVELISHRLDNADSGKSAKETLIPGDDSRTNSSPAEASNLGIEKSESNSAGFLSATVSTEEENVADVPKTPVCTPTITSVGEIGWENGNDEETFSSRENVLNSLESAKKKLMTVNDDIVEEFKENRAESVATRTDFHAEDVQQESEYTEHYDIATQRHLDSLTKIESPEASTLKGCTKDDESKCREAVALAKAESASHVVLRRKKSEEDVQLAAPPRPGTIAEREHKKWENAPPIENNPYSPESIQRRLLERQYSRRSSDIPGINAELPKSNGEDLDAMLAPHQPDIKRFGRDYYINDSRSSCNEKGRKSAASTASRPSSSLSQRSSSTGTGDQDQQEETQYNRTESLLNQSNDVKSKVARWQNNNLQNKYDSTVRETDPTGDAGKIKERSSGKIDRERTWEDQKLEEMLENERKNSKNEVNAKLNNQENYENSVIEAGKLNSNDGQRKIKRIDLKAYGFGNDLFSENSIKTSTPRVVNKLDLKSFGYDEGIRRTRSNVQLNSMDSEEFQSRFYRVSNKSNLTRHNNYRDRDRRDVIESSRASGDNILTQSTETLDKFDDVGYINCGMKSAKSVPNIAKFYSNGSSRDNEETGDGFDRNSYNELGLIKNGSVRNIANIYNLEKCRNIKSSDSSIDESEIDTDTSSEREQSQHSMTDPRKKSLMSDEEFDNKLLPMPSVRRLAEAFSKQSETALPVMKISKSNNLNKERSSTPEIQIIETPRQMHSLTARSLSKQFREGLKQIPNRVTSPPASHVVVEQANIPEDQAEMAQVKSENNSNDTNVILPGKLKSNIIFWEQMQRKH